MDVTTALMRLHQLETHLAESHPAASQDERVAGYLRSITDELTDQQTIAELDS